MSSFWSRLWTYRQKHPDKNRRELASDLSVPLRAINYRISKQDARVIDETSSFLESESGELFLKRLVVGTLYTFCIKSGVGAARVEEFFERLQIYSHVGISPSSILRILRSIEGSILEYQKLVLADLEASKAYSSELKVVLGIDETWLDEMLLVCQDLISGYLFLKRPPLDETPQVGGHH